MQSNKQGQGRGSVSRRGFLRDAGVLTGAVALAAMAGCSPQESAVAARAKDVVWGRECDVVVCGGGGGLLAACDAADAGNEVILLEKSPAVGGESSLNEGWINGAGTSIQRAEGVQDDGKTQAADYAINHAAHMNNVDAKLLDDYCENSGAAIERLIELGCEYELAQDTIFYTTAPRAHLLQPNASAWGKTLGAAAEERGVDVMTSTPLTSLVVDESNQVVGVMAGDLAIKARKGVILATGDVSGNERMKAKFQPDFAAVPACQTYNTGDGLFAALKIGADSSFDQYTAVGPCLMYEPRGSAVAAFQVMKGAIMVNLGGKRYADESVDAVAAFSQSLQAEGRGFLLFDSRVAAISHRPSCPVSEIYAHVLAGECVELGLLSGIGPAYLEDYLEEGQAVEAGTLEELASMCGINAAGLAEQIAAWNAAVASGVDEEYGRTIAGAMQFGDTVGIEVGPFYALKLQSPKWMCTEGPNLMVDANMSVLDVEGDPISRLFACGAGIMSGTSTLYANSCGDHMGITAYSARRAAARVGELASWES